MGRPAQPSNFFLRPSIPLSASMFLRQSPTSRFSWGGWRQRLVCLPGQQSLKYPPPARQPAGPLCSGCLPKDLVLEHFFSPQQSHPIFPFHFLSFPCTSCFPHTLPDSLMHFLPTCSLLFLLYSLSSPGLPHALLDSLLLPFSLMYFLSPLCFSCAHLYFLLRTPYHTLLLITPRATCLQDRPWDCCPRTLSSTHPLSWPCHTHLLCVLLLHLLEVGPQV